MTYGLTLHLAELPDRRLLEQVLEVLAEQNARWYLLHPDAPTPRQAGVRWVPDRPSTDAVFDVVPRLLERGEGSCGPIAAAAVGYHRAVERRAGRPVATTQARHRVALRAIGPRLWHAYHQAPWGLVDPTEGFSQ